MSTAAPAVAAAPAPGAEAQESQDAAAAAAAPEPVQQRTFYRRPLPSDLIAFSSPEGRVLFNEALADGGMESFFPLSEHFSTQSDPAFCGLGSLSMALNALGIDPGRAWKGPWRWFDESILDCCEPLPVVRKQGIPLRKLHCLARCNGARSRVLYGDAVALEGFRADVIRVTHARQASNTSNDDQADAEDGISGGGGGGPEILLAGYSRKVLGQTGDGHFSPIGGYHRGRDLVLLMDVARFKYPPHWVALPRLWEAFQPQDPATGKPRGYLLLTRPSSAAASSTAAGGGKSEGPSLLLSLDPGRYEDWPALRDWLLALHCRRAESGIGIGIATTTTAAPLLFEEGDGNGEEGFRRFLAALPPALAGLIAPLPAVGLALAREGSGSGNGGGDGCSGNGNGSPQVAVTRLIGAIEAHPLYAALTPEALAPFHLHHASSSPTDECSTTEQEQDSSCCCAPLRRVKRGGHALLLLYLALGQWVNPNGSESSCCPLSSEEEEEKDDEGRRLLRHEVTQLKVKLQALVSEIGGRVGPAGLG